MAYEGEELTFCPVNPFLTGGAYAVVVSGDGPNYWGHMLLFSAAPRGTYFQVAGRKTCPRYMNEVGYRRYLSESGKTELRRFPLHMKDAAAAHRQLEELLSKPWRWWGVVNNCETFVEEIVAAGGGRTIHQGLFYKPVDSRQQTPGASGSW
jgi:hypothetical protein